MTQDLRQMPEVVGGTRMCQNLYESGDGGLDGVGVPKVVGETGGVPVAWDRRGDRVNVFTQDDDGSVVLSLTLEDSGASEREEQKVGEVSEKIVQCASAGDFLVLRGEKGTLYYLQWREESGAYAWLGELPKAPTFTVKEEGAVEITGEVQPVEFSGDVTDLRGGLDSENLKRVRKALLAGYDDAVENAHQGGYRLTPAVVRVAWRLWDNRLLHVSEPKSYYPGGELPGHSRVQLTLATDSKGFTGTQGGMVSMTGFKLTVTPGESLPAAWKGVVKGVEVWVSQEVYMLRSDEEITVSASQRENLHILNCTLPVKSDQAVANELPGLPMSRQLRADEWGEAVTLHYSEAGKKMQEMTTEETGDVFAQADCILGYGDFLHLGVNNRLVSSVRGNPLVAGSHTQGIGSRVRFIWPQLVGGGAYTRQYIYCGTPNGVIAVTYDQDGKHTNARFISPVKVDSGALAAATPAGLFLGGAKGEVLKVNDAKAKVVMRRCLGLKALMWSGARGWLYLMGETNSLVLQSEAGNRGFSLSFRARPMFRLSGYSLSAANLAYYEMSDGRVSLYDLEAAVTDKSMPRQLQVILPNPPKQRERLRRLLVGILGDPTMAQIEVNIAPSAGRESRRRYTLLRSTISGRVNGGVYQLLHLRTAGQLSPQLELTLRGNFEKIESLAWVN